MSKYTIIILILIASSCSKSSTERSPETSHSPDCRPYFEYDRLDHFHVDISQDSASFYHTFFEWEGGRPTGLTPLQAKFADLLVSDSTLTISDTIRLVGIEELGFTRRQIDRAEFVNINSLLCAGLIPEEKAVNACIPEFRDILVFKDGGRTIGFAKLCFECDQYVFVGTDKNTFGFGTAGEFEKLAAILRVKYRNY